MLDCSDAWIGLLQDFSSGRGAGIFVSVVVLGDQSVIRSSPLKSVLCRKILPVYCLFPKFNQKSVLIKNVKVSHMGIYTDNFWFTIYITIVATRASNALCKINTRARWERRHCMKGVRNSSLDFLYVSSYFLVALPEGHAIPQDVFSLLFAWLQFLSLSPSKVNMKNTCGVMGCTCPFLSLSPWIRVPYVPSSKPASGEPKKKK